MAKIGGVAIHMKPPYIHRELIIVYLFSFIIFAMFADNTFH